MWAIIYKSCYIHGYVDKPECKVQFKSGNAFLGTFKSERAAKLAITRFIKLCGKTS